MSAIVQTKREKERTYDILLQAFCDEISVQISCVESDVVWIAQSISIPSILRWCKPLTSCRILFETF